MAKRKVKIIGTVTDVRVVNGDEVILFVKVKVPQKIKYRVVRFWIYNNNSANCLAECTAWTQLAVGDEVHIICAYEECISPSYELCKVYSDILDADELIRDAVL